MYVIRIDNIGTVLHEVQKTKNKIKNFISISIRRFFHLIYL